ncbi:serine/threonine-protein kinase [Allorhodopirellula heiligendammensis]|uniref:non-specific serine/threonine protein kinase n=1 Tax=Allorhodopirellula heiligendammensis TaxID=2714739 RepID=A0A5C6C2Y8_9BACT|nr:serine/threonine-protein kinase [Allorhodopirellula heiligendammensis]TWU18853.1 Serine/threonine-protein kinase PrkC [Allorhodopirellula heiligendammensis]
MSTDQKKNSSLGKHRPLQRVDVICDRYEQQWLAGERPDLGEFLQQPDSPVQADLFTELLRLDIHYRNQNNLPIHPQDVVKRFPNFQTEIQNAFLLENVSGDTSEIRRDQWLTQTQSAVEHTVPPRLTRLPLVEFDGYEILGEIARGGMGIVYRARQIEANRIVALKMILSGNVAGVDEIQRFKNEAKAAARLDHPNIVPVFDIGEQDGQHFFSMGFVNGPSLKQLISNERMDDQRSAEFVRTLARAVQYAHSKGIIHRDLKPANILLDEHGNPRITDFGLSKVLHSQTELTGTGQVLGTPAYMSPEQASGRSNEITEATDIYSLGGILYELLTGCVPFYSETVVGLLMKVQNETPRSPASVSQVRLSADLDTICMKCLEKNPSDRYSTAQDLADDLDRYLQGEPILARPISRGRRIARWCGKRPLITGLAACLVISVLVFGSSTLHFAKTSQLRSSMVESEKRQKDQNLQIALLAVEQMVEQAKLLADVPRKEKARVELLNKATDFYNRFRQQRPEDRSLQFQAALVHQSTGSVFRILDQFDRSQEAIETSVTQLDALIAAEPANRQYSIALSESYISMALLLKPRNLDLAFGAIEKAMAIQSELMRDQDSDDDSRHALARVLYNRGMMLSEQGQHELAESDYQAAIQLLRELVRYSDDPATDDSLAGNYRLDLGRTLNNYGNLLKQEGRTEEAKNQIRQAIDLHSDYADLREHRQDVAIFRNNLANTLIAQKQFDDALAENWLSIESLDELVSQFPRYASLKSELANVLNTRGSIMGSQNELEEAAEYFGRAESSLQKLTQDFPENFGYSNRMAAARYNVAVVAYMQNEFKKCSEILRNAIKVHQHCFDGNPHNEEFRGNLKKDYSLFIKTLQKSGDLFEMDQAIDECVATFPQEHEVRLNAARSRAQAYTDAKQSENKDIRESLGQNAVEDLRVAVQLGASTDAIEENGKIIEPLNVLFGRTDFQELLDELKLNPSAPTSDGGE